MKRAVLTLMARYARPALVGLLSSSLAACVLIDEGNTDGGGGAGTDGDNGNNGTGGDGADGSGGGQAPSMAQIGACQGDCDDLLLWNCVDATEHETCYGACGEKDSESLDIFGACVLNTTPDCDAATPCYINLLDADPVGGGGDDSTTCVDACEQWLGAGCQALAEAPSCQAFCDVLNESLHDFVVECVENRDGCMLPEECVFEEESGAEEGGGAEDG